MDFFEQQDQAHRQSKKLILLFAIAVAGIVLAINLTLALLWKWSAPAGTAVHYPPGMFVTSTVLILLFIACGSLYQTWQLRDGGDAVAEMAGGRLLSPDSNDPDERRLLNVVEEMALASGIACPHVYLLDQEQAINAFAAGYHANQAVVAVTRGTLMRLTRDELQGVVGHEFSHILNGDMRMNIRLIGILFGIQMLAAFGQEILYWASRIGGSRSRDDKGPPWQLIMLVLGASLLVFGYIGVFCGRLIKSAVSRQREFLADASAVQFTRNPDGIGGALKKIGGLGRVNQCGSRIDNPKAEQLSHMFLGAARSNLADGLFATHPPLELRLQRIYGKTVEFVAADELPPDAQSDTGALNGFGQHAGTATPVGLNSLAAAGSAGNGSAAAVAVDTAMAAATLGAGAAATATAASTATATGEHSSGSAAGRYPEALLQAARQTSSACALMYALLLKRQPEAAFQLQCGLLQQQAPQQLQAALQLQQLLQDHPLNLQLPLLDLALPALRLLDVRQRGDLLALVQALINADQQVDQHEFVLQTVLERRLGPQAGRNVPVRFADCRPLRSQVSLLLSLLASELPAEAAEAAYLRGAALLPELALRAEERRDLAKLDYVEVRAALQQCNQLAPLAKPMLIKALLQAAQSGTESSLPAAAVDVLRGICAALDAPVPERLLQPV